MTDRELAHAPEIAAAQTNKDVSEVWYERLNTARGLNTGEAVRAATKAQIRGYSRFLPNILGENRDITVYDAGCGPGFMLNILKELGYFNTMGSDLASDSEIVGQELGLSIHRKNSITHISEFSDASFDCVMAIDFIEHLKKEDFLEFIEMVFIKLKPGGKLILRCPNADTPFVGRHYFNDISHVWTYTSTSLELLFSSWGFRHIHFVDEIIPMIDRYRFFRVPMVYVGSNLIKKIIKWSTRENIKILTPSFWAVVTK